jgi:hypothetical protein
VQEDIIILRIKRANKMNKQFTITKKIAKHGKQAVIIIPTLLQEHLKYGTLVEIKIEIIAN